MRLPGTQNASRGFVDRQKRFWLMRFTGPQKYASAGLDIDQTFKTPFLAGTYANAFVIPAAFHTVLTGHHETCIAHARVC